MGSALVPVAVLSLLLRGGVLGQGRSLEPGTIYPSFGGTCKRAYVCVGSLSVNRQHLGAAQVK